MTSHQNRAIDTLAEMVRKMYPGAKIIRIRSRENGDRRLKYDLEIIRGDLKDLSDFKTLHVVKEKVESQRRRNIKVEKSLLQNDKGTGK